MQRLSQRQQGKELLRKPSNHKNMESKHRRQVYISTMVVYDQDVGVLFQL